MPTRETERAGGGPVMRRPALLDDLARVDAGMSIGMFFAAFRLCDPEFRERGPRA